MSAESIPAIAVAPPAEPAKAKPSVLGALKEWESKSYARWAELVQRLPSDHPGRLVHGRWSVSYYLVGDLQRLDLADFLDVLKRVKGRETGWPPWWVPSRREIAPYSVGELVECWLAPEGVFTDPAHSDFWRASPTGKMFLVRGFQEDGQPEFPPKACLDLTLPIWRVGECLLHASRLAAALDDDTAMAAIRFTWAGLDGRRLVAWANPSRDVFPDRKAHAESVESDIQVEASKISGNLPELVAQLTKPLYTAFAFFKPPLSMVEEELDRMRARASG